MNLADVINVAQKPARDRTERYTARLDKHLASLPDDEARLAFLRRDLANWLSRYRTFCGLVDSGKYKITADMPSAWDFTLTIAELDTRVGKLNRATGRA